MDPFKNLHLIREYINKSEIHPEEKTLPIEEFMALFIDEGRFLSLKVPSNSVTKISYYYSAGDYAEEFTSADCIVHISKSDPDEGVMAIREEHQTSYYLFHKDWLTKILHIDESSGVWIILELRNKPLHGTIANIIDTTGCSHTEGVTIFSALDFQT